MEQMSTGFVQKSWNSSELKKLPADKVCLAVPVAKFRKRTLPKPTITTLRTAPLLAELPLDWLERLVGVADWQEHRPNDILIRQNELSNSVYFVIAGYLKTIRGGVNTLQAKDQGHPDRRVRKRSEVMLALLGPGDMLGEVGYLLQIERPASVVALTPCQVIRIPGQEFLACIQEHPNFALAVTRKIAWQLLGSIHQLELMRGDLEGRIHALIRRCKSMGMDTERWLTNAEIARMVGATRVGVSQIMGRINRDTQDTSHRRVKASKRKVLYAFDEV